MLTKLKIVTIVIVCLDVDAKDDRSSDSRTTPITPQKLIAQLCKSAHNNPYML